VEELFAVNNRLLDSERTLGQSRFDDWRRALKSLHRDEDTDLTAVRQRVEAVKRLRLHTQDFGTDAFIRWMQSWLALPQDYIGELIQAGKVAFLQFIKEAHQLQELVSAYEGLSGMKLQEVGTTEPWLPHTATRLR